MSSAVKIVTLNYNANNQLTGVVDQAGRTTTLSYTSQSGKYQLNTITFPDGVKAYYSYYDGESALLKRAYDNEAKYGIEYTYTNQLGSKRINHIYEYYSTDGGTTVSYGQKMHAFKSNATYSRFRYYGADTTASTSDDIVARYAFDNYGRTVNIINMDSDEVKVLGVTAGSYMENSGTNATNNRMTSAASSGVQGINLLYNSGLEETENKVTDYRWIHKGGGSMALKASTETTKNVTPRTGNSLLKLYASGGAAERSAAYQQVHMNQGKTYVFSAYVNTSCVSSFGTGGEAYLSIQSVNDYEWARSETINYCTNSAICSGWVRLEVTFTPTYSGTFRPSVNLKNTANCSIAVDDLQLEEVIDTTTDDVICGAASSANLLQMGSFDIKNPSSGQVNKDLVSKWWTYNSSYAVPTTTDKISGYSMTLAGHTQGQRRASQEIKINGTSNTTYLLSGWGKTPASAIGNGTGLEGDNSTYKRFFGMIAEIVYTDTETPEYHYVSFNDDYSDWQYAVGTIVPKRADKTVSTITVTLAYDYCPNRAYIDNVALIEEPVQTYSYDEKGKVTMSAKTKNDSSTYTYDSAERLTGYTAINGVKYALTYTGNSRTTNTKVANSSGNRYYQSSATYSGDGNYQLSTTDANGVKASRTYNNKGLLASATTANSSAAYTYTNADRVATITAKDNAQLSYTYTKGTLSTLTRRSSYNSANCYQAYGFTLDPWGRSTAITVKKSTNNSTWSQGLKLASYTYAPNGGSLSQMTYSNGQSVKYTYDILDRLVKESYYKSGETTPYAENVYVYNSQGTLARQYRKEGGSITEDYTFEYDSLGRLIRSRENNSGKIAQRTEHLYDKANRLRSQQWIVGNTLFSEYYTYNANDGTLTKVNTPGVGSVVNSYDSLKNLYKQQYTTKSNVQYVHCYDRAMTDSGQVAPRVRGMAYYNGTDSSGGTIVGYRYGYDGDGNIKTIHDLSGTKLLAQYAYDAQNQLTNEYQYQADGTLDVHYRYDYDTAGNIQCVTVDGTVPLAAYKYEDSNWGDLLTEYTGKKIAYEGQTYNATANTVTGTAISGNPINWYNGTAYTNLTWQNGRQLASLQKGSNTYTYTYDMNGVRSSKTVNGVKHNYITQNGKVIREEYGTTVLEFVYDTNGAPYALRYSSDSGKSWLTYYYVLNQQGDVVKLIYTDGTVRAEYSYNAWGEILSATNPSSSTVNTQDINPLRYRGYYYDTETGWYYLQSRYYDPAVKRFISADSHASTGQGILGHNMFAYCNNNPICLHDQSGKLPAYSRMVADTVSVCVRDITNMLNSAMKKHYQEMTDYSIKHGRIKSYKYFKKKVRTGGEWDLKSQKEWSFLKTSVLIYNGEKLRYDDPGNIHYGYVGQAFTGEWQLQVGAGIEQIRVGTSSWSYWDSCFDDPRDQKMIKYGYMLALSNECPAFSIVPWKIEE